MVYREKQESKICLILNKENYYFSRDRLFRLSGFCQVYLEEYPQTEEINLSDQTFTGDDLCLFFQFLDTLDLPVGKESCLGLYQTAIYFCLVEKYMKLLRDNMTKYFLDKLGLVITFNNCGGYNCQKIAKKLADDIATSIGLSSFRGPRWVAGPVGPCGIGRSITDKEEKKQRKQVWRAQRRANRR